MCGRYELHTHPAAIALAFGLAQVPVLHPRYNIAPLTNVPVVRVNAQGERELVMLRWGLVPRWTRDPSVGSKMINARGETLRERHAFQIPYRRHRCLLPADGFYEWATLGEGEHGLKQPLHVGMKDGAPFGLAGLYERWLSPEGEVLDTCTIVTTVANGLLRAVHERMPAIIAPDDYGRWLDPETGAADDLLAPFPAERMAYYPVSRRVNAAANDDPRLIEPVAGVPEPGAAEPEADAPEQEELF